MSQLGSEDVRRELSLRLLASLLHTLSRFLSRTTSQLGKLFELSTSPPPALLSSSRGRRLAISRLWLTYLAYALL